MPPDEQTKDSVLFLFDCDTRVGPIVRAEVRVFYSHLASETFRTPSILTAAKQNTDAY